MMQKSSKIAVAAAFAGMAAIGGAAFTGAGLQNDAGLTAFLGGTATQSITGATLSEIVYNGLGANDNQAESVTFTLTGEAADWAEGKTLNGSVNGVAYTMEDYSTSDDEGVAVEYTLVLDAPAEVTNFSITVA
jgi:hypothetical protein